MASMVLHWQPLEQGARLVRVESDSSVLRLPAQVEGRSILEIGPYCFSATPPSPRGPVYTTRIGEDISLVPLAGNQVRGLELPSQAVLLDNAAFYNCRKLKWLRVGPSLVQTGSDLFSNCFTLSHLELDAGAGESTGLRKLLAALPGDMTVFIVSQRAASLQHADQILVLDDGHLVGVGTHSYLLEQCPVYREIYESQFKKGGAQ